MRRKAWRWVFGGLVLTAALAGLIVGDAFRRAAAVFERARGARQDLLAILKARPVRRPPLFEPPLPGNAWDHYGPALQSFEDMPTEDMAGIPELQIYIKMKAAPLDEAVLAKYRPLAAKLKDALRCGIADPALPFEAGYEIEFPHVQGAELACRFLAAESVFQVRARNADAGVEGLLAGFGLAEDVVRCGSIHHLGVGLVGEGALFNAAREILAGGHLPRASLDRLASGLERIDAWRLAPREGLDVDRYFRLVGLLDRPGFHLQLSFPSREEPGLRDLYSSRLREARTLAVEERLSRRLAELSEGPCGLWEDGVTDLQGCGEPGASHPLYEAERRFDLEIRRRAVRIVLRTAVAVARYRAEEGAFPPSVSALVPRWLPELPRCPRIGEPLQTERGEVWIATGGDVPREPAAAK